MATKSKKQPRENMSGSVKPNPGITTGRAQSEKRIGSGNRRSGQVRSEREINRRPAAKSAREGAVAVTP